MFLFRNLLFNDVLNMAVVKMIKKNKKNLYNKNNLFFIVSSKKVAMNL